MTQDELTDLIDKTATLMTQYERRGAVIDARLQALGDALQGLTQELPMVIRTSADGALQTLPAEMGSVMRNGLGQAMGDYRQRLDTAGQGVEKSSRVLALLLAGGAWLSMHYTRVIRDNQLSAELLKAYNGADVTLCGSGMLCANVDIRGPRHGEHHQYLPVKSR
jgi:hypothetical protein